jgi:hypothetical protein
MGKSRIAAAIAMRFLMDPKGGNVYILFSDEGLMKRDQEECELLWSFLEASNKKERMRLMHICKIGDIKTTTPCTIIVDESDDVIFEDLTAFYKQTKQPKRKIICLTASPDDGKEGYERDIM